MEVDISKIKINENSFEFHTTSLIENEKSNSTINNENQETNQANNIININNDNSKKNRNKKNNLKNEKIFICLECEKKYLSLAGLINHRKAKHNYEETSEKRKRGRPPKSKNKNKEIIYRKNTYNNFFKKEKRKKKNDNLENFMINSNKIKQILRNIFDEYKYILKVDEAENYSFFKFISNNWEKEESDLSKECLRDNNIKRDINLSSNAKMTILDGVFIIYLKEISKITNIDYFSFIIKFIVILREFINKSKESLVSKDIEGQPKAYYSQVYNAEIVPEICNNFFNSLPNNNYNLDKNELIEIVQHFCYWLYDNHYSLSHLVLLCN